MIQRFEARPEALASIRSFIRERAEEASFSEQMEALVFAVNEAATNAIQHADSSHVVVSWSQSDEHAEVEVRDTGVFRLSAPARTLAERGRGFPLMATFVDGLALKEGTPDDPGTVVKLVTRKR